MQDEKLINYNLNATKDEEEMEWKLWKPNN